MEISIMSKAVNCSDGQNSNVSSVLPINDEADDYDASGALMYIVCTMVVYSVFGVFCTLLVRVRRSRSQQTDIKDQDEAVEKYLKLERLLKFESDKRHMRNDIQKHAESITRFEEKMRIAEEERKRAAEELAVLTEAGKCIKKDKQRKLSFSFFPSRRQRPSQKHRKLSLSENLHSQAALSLLFVQSQSNTGNQSDTSRSTLQDIDEDMETVIDEVMIKKRTNLEACNSDELREKRTLRSSCSAPVLEILSETDTENNAGIIEQCGDGGQTKVLIPQIHIVDYDRSAPR